MNSTFFKETVEENPYNNLLKETTLYKVIYIRGKEQKKTTKEYQSILTILQVSSPSLYTYAE
jgi:hypothetical protein